MSDDKGAMLLLDLFPKVNVLIADKGYDGDPLREALTQRGIATCIPPMRHRKTQYAYDKTLYRQRHRIENLFARLKDWRRIHTRYDQCADIFFAAVIIAVLLLFWIEP